MRFFIAVSVISGMISEGCATSSCPTQSATPAATHAQSPASGVPELTVTIEGLANGKRIPAEMAFCVPADDGMVKLGPNRSPSVRWSGAPEQTKSYAVVMHDPDVPANGDDVNTDGKTIPKDAARVPFYHWVLVDIPADRTELPVAGDSDGVVAKGKEPGKTDLGLRGINDYTKWFAGQEDMAGSYGGYDGPCPPWNDERVHRYKFTVYALGVESLELQGSFDGTTARETLQDHVLAKGEVVGTYTLNPSLTN